MLHSMRPPPTVTIYGAPESNDGTMNSHSLKLSPGEVMDCHGKGAGEREKQSVQYHGWARRVLVGKNVCWNTPEGDSYFSMVPVLQVLC